MDIKQIFCFHNYELKKEEYLYSKKRWKVFDNEIWEVFYDYYSEEYECDKCNKVKKTLNKR